MKPLKRAEQKNVLVDTRYYTEAQLEALKRIEGVNTLAEEFKEDGWFTASAELRVFLESVKDLKVACIDGQYCTVAVMNTGETVYVEL